MSMTVGQLEEALFSAFPRTDAESWDQPGLSVGDRSVQVGKVAFNLDQSVAAAQAAAQAGCNVLVTHHPPFIKEGPAEFGPAQDTAPTGPGRMVFEAARKGINVIAMHTNADRAVATREAYAKLLGLKCEGNFEHLLDSSRTPQETGFGAVFNGGEGLALGALADKCLAAFGGAPRVWGDPDRSIRRFALLNGSWNEPELYQVCTRAGVDCIIVGETRYHFAVDAQPHLSVIELGHDKSEIAIVDVLRQAVIEAGVAREDTVMLQISENNWWTPERQG